VARFVIALKRSLFLKSPIRIGGIFFAKEVLSISGYLPTNTHS
jgi:hypothetical protein